MDNSNYLSVSQWADKYGKAASNVRKLIYDGRIPAVKIGNQWVISADVEPPPDKRVKSGKYRNWRNTR